MTQANSPLGLFHLEGSGGGGVWRAERNAATEWCGNGSDITARWSAKTSNITAGWFHNWTTLLLRGGQLFSTYPSFIGVPPPPIFM